MMDDPIVAEVHAAREKIFAECGYDHERFNASMREYSEQLKREGWIMADRPVVRRKGAALYENAAPETSVVREEPPAQH